MLIIQLIRDYLNGEKMPKRIRYGMMQDGYQYFRWDAEAEEYVCEADDKCFLSQVPWHHLRDFVEIAEQTEPNCSEKPNNCEPQICDTCRYYNSNIPCGSTPSACKEADKFAEEFVDGLKKLKLKTDDFFRNPTAEERKAVADYIDSISVPTGVNVFDLMDEPQTDARKFLGYACETCKHRDEEWDSKACDGCCENNDHYEPKDEPQIFICPIQDDYKALIEDEPQTEEWYTYQDEQEYNARHGKE